MPEQSTGKDLWQIAVGLLPGGRDGEGEQELSLSWVTPGSARPQPPEEGSGHRAPGEPPAGAGGDLAAQRVKTRVPTWTPELEKKN